MNGVFEGQAGTLWLSSDRGISLLETDTGTVRHFDRRNGLRGNEFTQGVKLKTANGRIMFGGSDGLVGFYPDRLPNNPHAPPISLAASSRTDVLATTATPTLIPSIELGYLDPFVTFDFSALDYTAPEQNRYRYRLEGFDAEWTDAGHFRRAPYTNLPPGNYRFQIQAANNDGVWNTDGAAIDVRVIPPPWATTLAYALYVLVVVGAVGWYAVRQIQVRHREAEQRRELERLVGERTRELADRMLELQLANEKLAEASITDTLTGLRNRRYVDQFISNQVSLVERRLVEHDTMSGAPNDSSRMLFFMMIDLDGFKAINDSFGHHAGDAALVGVTQTLRECCRESDAIIRWGGDEFMIIGHANDFRGVEVLAERVRVGIDRNYDVGDGNAGHLSASIGVTPYPFYISQLGFERWEQVAGIADQAAYVAKANGRNAWVSIHATGSMNHDDLARIRDDLPEMVANNVLTISTSISGELNLDGNAPVPRLVAS